MLLNSLLEKKFESFIGAFPNEGSLLRLLVPLAVGTYAKWLERKYLSWEDLKQDCEVDEEFRENLG